MSFERYPEHAFTAAARKSIFRYITGELDN